MSCMRRSRKRDRVGTDAKLTHDGARTRALQLSVAFGRHNKVTTPSDVARLRSKEGVCVFWLYRSEPSAAWVWWHWEAAPLRRTGQPLPDAHPSRSRPSR